MHNIVFLPKELGLAIDVSGMPLAAHELLHLEFSKYIHFSSSAKIWRQKDLVLHLSSKEKTLSATTLYFNTNLGIFVLRDDMY